MARQHDQLTALSVERMTKPGLHHDGHGLYLHVSKSGAKSWVLRYTGTDGKRHDFGLGSTYTVILAEARALALKHHIARQEGVDPIAAKRAADAERRAAEVRNVTFKQVAEQYIEAHRADWKSDKEETVWRARLRDYVFPVIGSLPVAMVDLPLILKVLEPRWATMASMGKIRGYLENILAFAAVKGYRSGDNPARWDGNLKFALSSRAKVAKVEHFGALPWREVGGFVAELRAIDKIGAKALLFAILTATRRGEVNGARWSEIDFKARTWAIPGSRMKAGKTHVVPLCDAALALLQALPRRGDLVFPIGPDEMHRTCTKLRPGIVPHGFRSCFRDFCYESTGFAREHVEHCLAHIEGSSSELAYKRGDALEKRRIIMNAWAKFCDTPSSQPSDNVRLLHRATA